MSNILKEQIFLISCIIVFTLLGFKIDSEVEKFEIIISDSIEREIQKSRELITTLKEASKISKVKYDEFKPIHAIITDIQSLKFRNYDDSIKTELNKLTNFEIEINKNESNISFSNRLAKKIYERMNPNGRQEINSTLELIIDEIIHDTKDQIMVKLSLFYSFPINENYTFFHKNVIIEMDDLLNSKFQLKDINVEIVHPITKEKITYY